MDVSSRLRVLRDEAARVAANTKLAEPDKVRIVAEKYGALMAPVITALDKHAREVTSTPTRTPTPTLTLTPTPTLTLNPYPNPNAQPLPLPLPLTPPPPGGRGGLDAARARLRTGHRRRAPRRDRGLPQP